MKLHAFALSSLLLTSLANAEITVYHWVDEDGNSHFSNIPQPQLQSEELSIPDINLYTDNTPEQSSEGGPEQRGNQMQQGMGGGDQQGRPPMQQGGNSSGGESMGGDMQGEGMMPPPPEMMEP